MAEDRQLVTRADLRRGLVVNALTKPINVVVPAAVAVAALLIGVTWLLAVGEDDDGVDAGGVAEGLDLSHAGARGVVDRGLAVREEFVDRAQQLGPRAPERTDRLEAEDAVVERDQADTVVR